MPLTGWDILGSVVVMLLVLWLGTVLLIGLGLGYCFFRGLCEWFFDDTVTFRKAHDYMDWETVEIIAYLAFWPVVLTTKGIVAVVRNNRWAKAKRKLKGTNAT